MGITYLIKVEAQVSWDLEEALGQAVEVEETDLDVCDADERNSLDTRGSSLRFWTVSVEADDIEDALETARHSFSVASGLASEIFSIDYLTASLVEVRDTRSREEKMEQAIDELLGENDAVSVLQAHGYGRIVDKLNDALQSEARR